MLRYLANGSFQLCVADCLDMVAASVCRFVKQISSLTHVKFPPLRWSKRRITRFSQDFRNLRSPKMYRLHTHTHWNPGWDNAEYHRWRKDFMSANAQAVRDFSLKYTSIVRSWPCIFENALICTSLAQENCIRKYLLGDSGYSCRSYPLPPTQNPQNEKEKVQCGSSIIKKMCGEAIGSFQETFQLLENTSPYSPADIKYDHHSLFCAS